MNEAFSARQRAYFAQQMASDPRISAWVGASAGSGKTKVLTDRVLRLLLREDTQPGRILCLTFTKAAAAEMATRLAARLGQWSVLPEPKLRVALEELIGQPPTRAELETARRLFCRVLEQPGGMRIATIHAFCQSLLRSFPLEARLPPAFTLLEEADSATLLAEAREAALAGRAIPDEALAGLARLVSADSLAKALRELVGKRERLRALLERADGHIPVLRECLDIPDGEAEDMLMASVVRPPDSFREALATLVQHKNKGPREAAATLLAILSEPEETRSARWEAWYTALFTQKGEPRAALAKDDACAAEMKRVEGILSRWAAHRLLGATGSLLSAARPVLEDYKLRKQRRGALDFDDLIHRAQELLRDPGSAWVLFKLDGGLDHLLLDEAQDTNPVQWGIAQSLAEEFFSGTGTREAGERTLFVVGDEKQSIFGFQGADARGFAEWETRFDHQVTRGGAVFERVPLNVSFRSCEPVLSLVDHVFADGDARKGVVRDGATLEHSADRAGHAGKVEIWPLLEHAGTETPEPWVVPREPVAAQDSEALLAEAIAARIGRMIAEEKLPARGGRPIHPGDIMVLVRRRTRLIELLVRQLKQRGIPVGGVDRMVLVEQIAVRDMLALCDVLLLPEDDLALAALLKSPLIGLSEDDLFALAHGREGPLWHGLIKHRHEKTPIGQAASWIAALADRADLITPHALLSEVLGEHGGRARLLARLGAEAAEALDELLSAALRHENRHAPSLQSFVQWLRRGGAEVKREMENAADAVRIMTAHGSKGLQAPVVIIPDIGRGGMRDTLLWSGAGRSGANAPEIPLWAPRKEFQAAPWTRARDARAQADAEEENRLLYVALTRAEDRLIVCGLAPRRTTAHPSWHALVKAGVARGLEAGKPGFAAVPFDPTTLGLPEGCGFGDEGWEITTPQEAEPRIDPPALRAEDAELPAWATIPAPPEASEDPIAPSRMEGEAELPAAAPHGAGDPSGRRFRRGLLIHGLLQHLPEHDEARWEELARRHLARPGHGLDPSEREATLAETLAVLRHPALDGAFGPGSLAEAPLAGVVNGIPVAGQVDRLLVTADRVLVLDYKTNRPPPSEVSAVPPTYLRQMAAYRAVLRAAWPGRRVECALVWTWSGHVMPLPDAAMDPHAPGAGKRA
ncbi:double-strand break repair helicase AddA [Roseomonas xinghualingensis]|uniref:double-strand break repair helicase AddA n=1 Tax=Roseomonas xinghualingensis TaxID=2986475 RepID=UPI0021F22DEB|nr:double-strand break repair helicase AddA [Roseomonas sp. SXEYE001]MCV4208247.1 double-strand break repair helicase AddA [Roseomonas sp. SXEYE001]